jgi:transcriptional regulator with XRE-family HTH domain
MKRRPEDCRRLYATGPLIRSLMQLGGLTIRQLAAQVGVSQSTAHSFVSGKLVDTSTELAERYAGALKVQTDLIFVPMRSSMAGVEFASSADKAA